MTIEHLYKTVHQLYELPLGFDNRAGTLFSGCGGSGSGNLLSGYNNVIAADIDPHSKLCYQKNFSGFFYDERITADTGKILLHILQDLVYQISTLQLSPPCQPYSGFNTSGTFRWEDVWAFYDSIEVIKDLEPLTFVVENTKDLLKINNQGFLEEIDTRFYKLNDYVVKRKVLLASDYGVPQQRERLIWIGVHKSLGLQPVFPAPICTDKRHLTINSIFDGGVKCVHSKQFKELTTSGDDIMRTITATMDAEFVNMEGRYFRPPIRKILDLQSFDNHYQLYGHPIRDYIKMWRRIGNSVPPLMQKAIVDALTRNILIPHYYKNNPVK